MTLSDIVSELTFQMIVALNRHLLFLRSDDIIKLLEENGRLLNKTAILICSDNVIRSQQNRQKLENR